MKLTEFKRKIEKLGYKFESSKLTLEINSDNKKGYVTDCIIEIDSKISAFHYKEACRDENFKKLQDLREEDIFYKNNIVWV